MESPPFAYCKHLMLQCYNVTMLRFRRSIGVTTYLLATKCVNKLKRGG